MTSAPDSRSPAARGTFRFVNVKAGTDSHRSIEIEHDDGRALTDLHPNTTEEEVRAKMVSDGYTEIDRNGTPIDVRHNILQNEIAHQARAIIDDAIARLALLGIIGFNQPIVSPVDGSAGWFLIAAKNQADVTSLRALLTAGCDGCSGNHDAYVKALEMLALMGE